MFPFYDAAREELEYEFNSRYDYVSEAHAHLADTPADLAWEAYYDRQEMYLAAVACGAIDPADCPATRARQLDTDDECPF